MKTNPFNESQIRPDDKFGRFLLYLSTLLSILGGCVLILIVIINVFYYVLFNQDIMIVRKEPLFDVNS